MGRALDEKRKKIDGIDARLAGLLARRFSIVRSMTGLKNKVRDTEREAMVLERALGQVSDKSLHVYLRAVYREIMRQGRSIQASRSSANRKAK